MKRDASPLISALLVVLLGASPLVGPVCALLCGHPLGSANSHAHDADHAHDATHEHGMHAGQDASAEPASVDARVSDVTAMSSGESCCAFDIASTVVAAAARLHLHPPGSQAGASEPWLIVRDGVVPHRAPPAPVPPRPDVSSARLPLVLRI